MINDFADYTRGLSREGALTIRVLLVIVFLRLLLAATQLPFNMWLSLSTLLLCDLH